MNYIISDIDQYYSTFEYPQEFIISIQKGIVDWGSWYIVPEQRAKQRLIGLMKRYPNIKLIPFAKRDDCDDIACFEVDRPNFVEIIHDFSSPGFEQRQEYTSLKQWISIITE